MEAGNEALLQDILFQATNHVYQAMRSRMLRGEPLGSTYDNEGRESYYILESVDSTNSNPKCPKSTAPASRPSLPSTPEASKYTFVNETPGDGYREIHSPQPSPDSASPTVDSSLQLVSQTSEAPPQFVSQTSEFSPLMASQTMSDAPSLVTESATSDVASPESHADGLLQAIRETHVTEDGPDETHVTEDRNDETSKPAIKKASRLKRSFTQRQGRAPSGRRLMGDLDPENREIMRLRQEKNLDFDEIAQVLNRKRMKIGLPTTLTSNAIYSRYKRNAPLIAAADGKEFVPTARDQKKGGQSIQFSKATVVRGFDANEDALLVQAVHDIEDRKWELIAARLNELGGKRHDSEMCALRYHYL